MNSLRGVFPEPRTAPRRNFIKENMKYLRRGQNPTGAGLAPQNVALNKSDKYQNVPPKLKSASHYNYAGDAKRTGNKGQPVTASRSLGQTRVLKNNFAAVKEKPKARPANASEVSEDSKISERGVQTESTDDLTVLYDTGVIKYPSPHIISSLPKRKSYIKPKPDPERAKGDAASIVVPNPHNDEDGDRRQARNNEPELKRDSTRRNLPAKADSRNPMKAPPNYQKGVVPKYIKERKEERLKDEELDPQCPEGHVALPDNERKETLRMLRQSYADLVAELNMMPVKTDTLRMRNRKMELEKQLKKLDEGIKVFTRPKVFVKIGA